MSLNNTSVNASATSGTCLTPIDFFKISEIIQEWETFYSVFKVMVHQDDEYSPPQTFYYLRSTLTSQALDLIKFLSMMDANYTLVIKKLQSRYDNKDLIIWANIQKILNSSRVEFVSALELLELPSYNSTLFP